MSFYEGHDVVSHKPRIQDYTTITKDENDNKDGKEADPATGSKPTEPKKQPSLDKQTFHASMYNAVMDEWRDNDKRVRFALGLLQAAVEPYVWTGLSSEDATNPRIAWFNIRAVNGLAMPLRVERALQALHTAKFSDFKYLRDFIVFHNEQHQDIINAQGTFTLSQLAGNINRRLPARFNPFIDWYQLTNGTTPMTDDTYRKYMATLYQFAENHRERWERSA